MEFGLEGPMKEFGWKGDKLWEDCHPKNEKGHCGGVKEFVQFQLNDNSFV